MKALSLHQPWAWALFHGKPVENRGWQTKYRGPLLIHTTHKFDQEGYRWIKERFPGLFPSVIFFPKGEIIGRVTVVDCVTEYPSPWFFGPYGFVLENPIEFKKTVPWKGNRRFFEIPETWRWFIGEAG